MKTSSIVILASMIFLSCSSESTPVPDKKVTISLGDLTDVEIINDELSLIDGSIYTYMDLGDGRVIISDQKPGLYFMEDNEITAVYGGEGQGPCEYSVISGIDVKGDKLYVLAGNQTKIITYDLNTKECLNEFTSEGLSRFNYIHKADQEDEFIVGNGTYIGIMPENTSLLRKISSNGDFQDLGLYLGRINTVQSVIRLVAPGMEFVKHEDKLYSYFPLTDSLYSYDLNYSSIASFPLNIDVRRDELEEVTASDGTNIEDVLEVINGGYTFVTRILATKDWVAVATAQNQPGDQDQKKLLKFFRPDGEFIGETPYENNILGFSDGRLVQVIESNDPNTEFVYSIGYREVNISSE